MQLLEAESRLERLLTEARARADTVVREAEARARERLASVDTALTAAAEAARQRHAAECAERIEAMTRETDTALRRYQDITRTRIGALAQWVADQVLRDVAGEGAGG
jgi:hypothetical protein